MICEITAGNDATVRSAGQRGLAEPRQPRQPMPPARWTRPSVDRPSGQRRRENFIADNDGAGRGRAVHPELAQTGTGLGLDPANSRGRRHALGETALPRGLRCASERHAPANQLAAEIVQRPLTGCTTGAAPLGEAAVVRQEGEVARVLGRIAVPTVTRAIAIDPMFAGAARRRGRSPQHAGRERARCLHLALLAAPKDRGMWRGTVMASIVRVQSNARTQRQGGNAPMSGRVRHPSDATTL